MACTMASPAKAVMAESVPVSPEDHHDDAAEQNHGEPVSSILAHIARQHDGLSLEGDGGH